MQPETCLKSLELKHDAGSAITSVRCNLTNGMSSPAFEMISYQQKHYRELVLDDRVAAVAAADTYGKGIKMCRLRFFNNLGAEIASYNPKHFSYKCTMHVVADDEELIGVYGSMGPHYISSLGFLVKK